ncbi:dTDP-4-dehydrorhamnose reductase [Methylocystis sp. JAN1]|uniref:dTDP-4-dehydrorhamnose reductase n=1 Tax=Methylocystis sp. JAN1 TaxID=3397211 RepID=UPI003FA2A3F5
MRIAVTGKQGQVVASLIERGAGRAEIIAVGRPEFDLSDPPGVARTLDALRPDVIVNAAAYTMVDKAESDEEGAARVNARGAGAVAEGAARLGTPIIHISTDYVFDGQLDRPYREDDATGPTGAYGRSKLEGERRVAAACDNHAILRTAWVYSPFGANFVKTMLRLGETRSEVGVVADQRGNPTSALDIADGVLAIASRMTKDPSRELRGVFHMSGAADATWADFAEEVFALAQRSGRAPVSVKRIATADYPTPAKRPANSRLDNSKLRQLYGVALPDWRPSLAYCVERLLRHS